jgi:DNA (cytosine-5)-methyltransferase 1
MLRVFETFTGYGGASWALRKAGVEFEVVGYSEIDKYAIKNFELNFPECVGKNFGDITKIDASLLPDFDFMCGGPPCQAFSVAGQRKGFDDVRGTLWFDFFRIAKEKKPKYMLIENVRGLDNHDNGKTLKVLLHCLSDLGYGVCYKNLNSKDFNTPQNRDRVWFVCKLGGWDFGEYRFPEKEKRTRCLKDVLEPVVDSKYFLSEKKTKLILEKINTNYANKINPEITNTRRTNYGNATSNETYIQIDSSGKGYGSQQDRAYFTDGVMGTLSQSSNGGNKSNIIDIPEVSYCIDKNYAKGVSPEHCEDGRRQMVYQVPRGEKGGIINTEVMPTVSTSSFEHNCMPVLTPDRMEKRQNGRRMKEDGEDAFTLNTQDRRGIYNGLQIRRLTPKEAFRLQGFFQDEINLSGISDSRLYALAGNGWDVNTASKIIKNMFKGGL